jgi:hypothetical protein
MLFCPGAPKPMAFHVLPVDNVDCLGFNVTLPEYHVLAETFLAKMIRQQKTVPIFQLVSVFKFSVTHFRVAHATHQAVTIKTTVCCALVRNFNILA